MSAARHLFSASDGKLSTVDRVKSVPAVRSCCLDPKPFGNDFCKAVADAVRAVIYIDPYRLFIYCGYPIHQLEHVGMRRYSLKIFDMCRNPDILSEQIHIPRTVQKPPAESTLHLITHKEDRTLRSP